MPKKIGKIINLKLPSILVVTILSWSLAFMGIKVALSELNFMDLTLLRFLVADIVFVPYLLKKRRYLLLNISDIPRILILGILGVTLYHLCLNYGEIHVSSGVASLIIATAPVFIFLGSIVFLNETFKINRAIGTGLALIGVAVIVYTGSEVLTLKSYFGASAILIAALSASFYTIYGKRLFNRYPPAILTAYAIIFGTIPLPIIILLEPEKINAIMGISQQTWLSVLFLGIISTVIGYQGWFYLLERMDASRAAVLLEAIPVVAVSAGVVFLGEHINSFFVLGALLVIIGVYLVNKKNRI